MKVLSLFSGIGGFDLAAQRCGMETIMACEIDGQANTVFRLRFPGVPIHEDIRTLEDPPAHDVLCGGFPCQDLSVAGRRAGLAGERSGLFHEIIRIAGATTPRWILLENVPGLRSSWSGDSPSAMGIDPGRGGRMEVDEESDFATVIFALTELGYGVAWRGLDAQHFGLAQRRERVFFVGCLGDPVRAAKVLFEPESVCWDFAEGEKAGEGIAPCVRGGLESGSNESGNKVVAGTLTACAKSGGWSNSADHAAAGLMVPVTSRPLRGQSNASHREDSDTYIPEVSPPLMRGSDLAAGHKARSGRSKDATLIAHSLRAEGHDASEDGTGRGTPIVLDMSNAARADECGAIQAAQVKGNRGYAVAFGWNKSARQTMRCDDTTDALQGSPTSNPAIAFQESQTGCREYKDAGALRAGGPGHDPVGTRIREGMAVRRLTPIECERLQGFPDRWTKYGRRKDGRIVRIADSPRYRMLGNAVAVPVVEWILARMMEDNA